MREPFTVTIYKEMGIFIRNVEFGPPLKVSSWRKIAIGTWKTAGDPSVYGMIEFDVGPMLAYLEESRKTSGLKITLTHGIGRAIAVTLARHPEINCVLRWGRLYPRKSVDIFYQVASDIEGKDLSGMVIRQADQKSVAEIAREMHERVESIRKMGDPSFRRMKGMIGLLPGLFVSTVITLTGYLMYVFNCWSPLLGSPRDPFGSVMITSIGSLGLDLAFAPLVPYSRVPLLIAIGAVHDAPVVRDGKIEIAQMAKLCATIDHRLIDGVHAGNMNRTLKTILANPSTELA